MKEVSHSFTYAEYESTDDLTPDDADLVHAARKITANAYAPYSNFLVGAVASMMNGARISGTNQENASYPVTICAERVLLSVASTEHPGVQIHTIAISYNNLKGQSIKPISPCGMCRQSLSEYESRLDQPIRIILSGQSGKVYVLDTAAHLLPLSFGGKDIM
jgi:cytidine deaminase